MYEYIEIDGKKELITDAESLIRAIDIKHYEIADMLRNEYLKTYTERELQEKRIQIDIVSYEASLEENRYAFGDILEELKEIENQLSSKRINKEKALKAIDEIKKIINNVC